MPQTGTLIPAPINTLVAGDNYATHVDVRGQGGFRAVANSSDRTSILSNLRSKGMLVYEIDTGKTYQLASDLTTWDDVTAALAAVLASNAVGQGASTVSFEGLTGTVQDLTGTGGAAIVGTNAGWANAAASLNARAQVFADYTAAAAITRAYNANVMVVQSADGGVFRYDASDTTSSSDATQACGSIIVDAAGRRWKRQNNGPLNVMWYINPTQHAFIIGQDLASQDASIVFTGINEAIAAGIAVQAPPGYYLVNDKIVVSTYQSFVGVGQYDTIRFYQSDNTKAVIQCIGNGEFGNFRVMQYGTISAANTGAHGVEFSSVREAIIYPIRAQNCYYGFTMPQSGSTIEATANTFFNNTVIYLSAGQCYGGSFDFRSYNAGSSGNFFGSLRSLGLDANGTTLIDTPHTAHFKTFTDNHFGFIDIEHGSNSVDCIFWDSCETVSYGAIHFEAMTLSAANASLMTASVSLTSGGSIDLRTLTVPDGIAAFCFTLYGDASNSASIELGAFHEISTTIGTGSSFKVARYTGSAGNLSKVSVAAANTPNISIAYTGPTVMNNIIKKWGQYQADLSWYGSNITFQGDADLTVSYGTNGPDIVYSTNLTAARTLTLPTTNLPIGAFYNICRNDSGAFNLTVTDGGSFSITLAALSQARVKWSGTSWVRVGR